MFSQYQRFPATCIFTIHNVRLAERMDDDFSVEWKRRDHKGMTERAIPHGDIDVFFEKRFKCPVTIYMTKKTKEIKSKFIHFTVNRFVNGITKKVFGKVDIDIAKFYNTSPITKQYELESPHSKKSYIFISITAQPVMGANGPIGIDTDLGSVSEALDIHPNENTQDWDVTEASPEEQQKKIESFFEERAQKKTESLSVFQSRPKFKRSTSKSLLIEPSPLFPIQKTENDDSHKITHKPPPAGLPMPRPNIPHPIRTPTRGTTRRTSLTPAPLQRANTMGSIDLANKDNSNPELLKEQENEMISYAPPARQTKDYVEKAKEYLKLALNRQWCESPLPEDQIPQPSVAIFSAMLASRLFDEESVNPIAYKEIIEDFLKRVKVNILVTKANNMDRFLIILYLILLLERQTGTGVMRRAELVDKLCKICSYYMDNIVDAQLENLRPIGTELIEGALDNESLVKLFKKELTEASNQVSTIDYLKEFFDERIRIAFQGFLINLLCSSPHRCTFGNSIQLNSFLTMLSDENIELPIFRQAVSVLQMGMAICDDPNSVKDICPLLPKTTVVKLLSTEQPDEFLPMPNDVMKFISYFNVDTLSAAEMPCKYEGRFDELAKSINTDSWKSVKFDDAVTVAYPFLNQIPNL